VTKALKIKISFDSWKPSIQVLSYLLFNLSNLLSTGMSNWVIGIFRNSQWAKSPKKAVCRSVFECRINKKCTFRRTSFCFFGDFAHWVITKII